MNYFFPVFAISVFNASSEALTYNGILPNGIGAAVTYLEIVLILGFLLVRKKEIAAIIYISFLGSSLTEVNFLQEQGFITASAFLTHPGFQALRVPGLPIGWSTALALILLISAFHRRKIDAVFHAKLKFFFLILAFGAIATAFSALSYLGDTFSQEVFFKDVNRFLISVFSFGLLFLNFKKQEAMHILLGLGLGTLVVTAVLYRLDVTRLYAGSSVALSVPAHAYIFLIAFMIPRIDWPVRVLVFSAVMGVAFLSNFLMSGKTIISLILLLILILSVGVGRRLSLGLRLAILPLIAGPVLLLDFNSIGTFFIEQGYELTGYKIRQLAVFSNWSDLGATIFFHSSGGNLVAEFLTISAMLIGVIPEHFPLVGLGFGGQISDHFDILVLSNADSYTDESFQSGRFSGMHLAFLTYLFWGGIFGALIIWNVTVRYILPNKEVWLNWAMMMSFLIFGLADKFDTALFMLLLSAVLAERHASPPITNVKV